MTPPHKCDTQNIPVPGPRYAPPTDGSLPNRDASVQLKGNAPPPMDNAHEQATPNTAAQSVNRGSARHSDLATVSAPNRARVSFSVTARPIATATRARSRDAKASSKRSHSALSFFDRLVSKRKVPKAIRLALAGLGTTLLLLFLLWQLDSNGGASAQRAEGVPERLASAALPMTGPATPVPPNALALASSNEVPTRVAPTDLELKASRSVGPPLSTANAQTSNETVIDIVALGQRVLGASTLQDPNGTLSPSAPGANTAAEAASAKRVQAAASVPADDRPITPSAGSHATSTASEAVRIRKTFLVKSQ
jgi:hypothetical protein